MNADKFKPQDLCNNALFLYISEFIIDDKSMFLISNDADFIISLKDRIEEPVKEIIIKWSKKDFDFKGSETPSPKEISMNDNRWLYCLYISNKDISGYIYTDHISLIKLVGKYIGGHNYILFSKNETGVYEVIKRSM